MTTVSPLISGRRQFKMAPTPASAASTFPSLSTTKTPLVVPLGGFFIPIAPIKLTAGSHSSVYGKFCFVLNVAFDLGESLDKPYIAKPVAVKGL